MDVRIICFFPYKKVDNTSVHVACLPIKTYKRVFIQAIHQLKSANVTKINNNGRMSFKLKAKEAKIEMLRIPFILSK